MVLPICLSHPVVVIVIVVVVVVVVVAVVIELFHHFASSFSYRSFYPSSHQQEEYDGDGDVLHFFSW